MTNKDSLKFNLLWAIGGGIFLWFICKLLVATTIFDTAFPSGTEPSILPNIGLFIGFIAGGFKDRFGLNLF